MPFPQSLMLAEMAVKHVEHAMTYGATNKPEDRLRRRQKGLRLPYPNIRTYRLAQYFALFQDDPEGYKEGEEQFSEDPSHNVLNILWQANCARNVGMGNCGEQAAIAFQYLVEEKRVDSVAYYSFSGHNVSHAFVVLGLTEKPLERQFVNHDQPPAGWPPGAVWCDPWYHEWFKIYADWGRKTRDLIWLLARDDEMFEPYELRCIAYHHADLGDWV